MRFKSFGMTTMLIIIRHITIVALLLICSASQAEISVQAIALFNGKAMLSIDGSRAKIIKAGDSFKGITLIEATTDHAVVEVNGQRETITLHSGASLSTSLAAKRPVDNSRVVQVWADDRGFFRSRGEINGRSLEFLVDTGANLVVLSSSQADRIDLDYLDGQKTSATTASGISPMYMVELDRISFDGIELRNISAGVIVGYYPPVPLLGMSFLEQLDMNRSGSVMKLKKH